MAEHSGSPGQMAAEDESPRKYSPKSLAIMLRRGWVKLELDLATICQMMKGALPPTIALAMYQSDAVSSEFTTLGYLMTIVSVLGFAIMPRAKFIQMIILDILAVCVAASIALLMMFCCVKSRQHAPSIYPTAVGVYNSSASAVSGVWLFFQIFVVHSLRAKFPQFQFPVILYSIITNISCVYGPQFTSMASAISFMTRMLKACLTGLALATVTSFIVFPLSTRTVVFKEMAGYIGGLRAALKAHSAYFETLEHDDMFGRAETVDETIEKMSKKGKIYSPEAQAIRTAVQKITDLHGKLHGDLTFAKREFALGELGPDDLQLIFRQLRRTMIPVVGLSFIVDVFQRLSEYNKWNDPIDSVANEHPTDAIRARVVQEWNDIMKALHDPFALMIQTVDEGLEHVSFTLKLTKPPKRKAAVSTESSEASDKDGDVEASPENTAPGEKGFAKDFKRRLGEFRFAKRIALQTWAEEKGLKLPDDFFDRPTSMGDMEDVPNDIDDTPDRDRSRRQLYLILFMEQLLHSAGQMVLDFVHFADEKAESGKLSRTRFVIPGAKRLLKWVASVFQAGDSHEGDQLGDVNTQNNILQLGEAYKYRKDPEHLPARTTWEKFGDKIRIIPNMLRSKECGYGFRVACATMTIAVIAYLRETQLFFVKQRLFWAIIMVNLSMSPTSGQSIFGFVLRILGTTIAMCVSFLAWYIPNEHTAGTIVFFFVFVTCAFYIPIKMFRFRIIGIITIITTSMIIGYELQVRKVGQQVATSNGQPFYPIYLLAPYRLATVAGGIGVAFIWTFFPYPMSEHSVLRQSLGASLYLLANYYSLIHETVSARMRGDEGDMALKSSSGRRLEKARNQVFSKQVLMLNGLRTYSDFLRWEVPIGGRFPKKRYDSIIVCIENVVSYLSLLGYASETLSQLGADEPESAWIHDFKVVISKARITTHEVTSVLCLLSASITNRQPLPPYLKTPRPYGISRRLESLDKDILSIRHMAEPGFAAFAVLQISTRCIVGDVDRLLRDVKALVGELDFSFHAVSTRESLKSKSTMNIPGLSRASSFRDKTD